MQACHKVIVSSLLGLTIAAATIASAQELIFADDFESGTADA